MKRSGFRRPVYEPAAVDRGRITRRFTLAGGTTAAAPKSPADRSQALRDLARGEECTVLRYAGHCRCHPDTVVWAHTNTQADEKGTGYKGHDSAGFFAGAECHSFIDQPPPGVDRAEIEALVKMAQERTTQRLRELAASPTIKPWRREAARWALERRC